MDKGVGMGFQFTAAVVIIFVGSAKAAASVHPDVFDPTEADIAIRLVESFAD